jgi:hypothetical protein
MISWHILILNYLLSYIILAVILIINKIIIILFSDDVCVYKYTYIFSLFNNNFDLC